MEPANRGSNECAEVARKLLLLALASRRLSAAQQITNIQGSTPE